MKNVITDSKTLVDTEFTGMHLSEIGDFIAPGDEEEIVNEQEQNEIVNEEESEQTTNINH